MTTDVPIPSRPWTSVSRGIVPAAYPAESAQDYLMRALQINGARWSARGFEANGKNIWQMLLGNDLSALHEFGLSPETFAGTTARVRSKTLVGIGREEISRRDWTTHSRRWCPLCLQHDPDDETLPARKPGWRHHRRFWWDALCIGTCPIHHVMLETRCPVCNEAVRRHNGTVTTCRRGHSLLACSPRPVPAEHCAADAYMVGRLGGAPRIPAPMLDGLTLGDAVEAMARLGAASSGGPRAGLKNIEEARHPETLSEGFRIAAGWPETIGPLLDSLSARFDDPGAAGGINDVYGELAKWARRIGKTDRGKELLDAILRHHARRVAVKRSSAAASFADDTCPVHLSWVAERCGKTKRKILRYADSMGISVDRSWPGFPMVGRDDAKRILAAFDDAVGAEEVAEMLGVSSLLLARMERDGVVGPSETHLRTGAGHRRYSRSEILDFVERVAGGAPSVDVAPDGLRPICASNALIGTGGLGAVVKDIFAGRGAVKARIREAKGLNGLLIDRDEFRALRRGLDPHDVVPFKDVAKLIGVDHETAAIALSMEMIIAVKADGKGTMISRRSIDEFLGLCTTTVKLVGPSKSRQIRLRNQLRKAGIVPVISHAKYLRCKTNVYRKADLPKGLADVVDADVWTESSSGNQQTRDASG